ncbi:response regulator [Mucilaginibacter flavidus]|uniref:response regulator n=1 Tax=Mucilaginibacter flavidus TaxID=2949309 RepID=UPI0020929CEA|nr:response regulator transcription factor [Mucilaginibacter flavidus]MCO5950470.1 response regulator transcription factor [Mucilaginibacter flavidus]
MITVAIVEDDVYIRSSVLQFLQMQPEFSQVNEFGSVEEFMQSGIAPDVLLLDIELPGITGLEGAFHIKQQHPQVNILMLTVYEDKERIFRALQAGATGYLLKNTPLPKIKAAVLDTVDGGVPMSPLVAKKVIAYFAAKPAVAETNASEQLTGREHEVAKLLINGDTYKQVAWRLNISPDTVRQHIKHIYRKLQINSRVQLINEFR